MNSSPGTRKKIFPLSLIGAVVFFAILWRLGFPEPNYDDLFYSGVALNLASGGDFSNPLLARQGFPSHYFFVYPPLHSFVFAGWLKLFGINSTSVTLFPIANILVACASVIALLRRYRVPVWAEWLVPLGLSHGLLRLGLRPETLAVALTLLGFAVSESSGTSKSRLFTGLLLLFLGMSCAPRVAPFALSFAICACINAALETKGARPSQRTILCLFFGAALATALLFLVLIDFKITEFAHTFQFHATRVSGKNIAILKEYMGHVRAQWPLVIVGLGLLAYCARKPKDGLIRGGIAVACAFAIAALIGALGYETNSWASLALIMFGGAFARQLKKLQSAFLASAIALILIITQRRTLMEVAGIVSGNILRDAGDQVASAKLLKPTAEHPLLVDGEAARSLFGYRLPEGTLDFSFGAPFPGGLPGDLNDSEIRKGDIYVVGPDSVKLLTHSTYLDLPVPVWDPFGLQQFEYVKFPRQIYIIPSESCKGSRGNTNEQRLWMPKNSTR